MRDAEVTTEGGKTTDSGQGMERYFFRASAADFKKIPGSPIAYWVGQKLLTAFMKEKLRDLADAKQGMATSDNERFLRLWHEVDFENTCFQCKSSSESEQRDEKWYAYNKGGTFRRWYGNNEYVVNWHKNGKELNKFVEEINKLRPGGRLKNQEYYFLENITYSALSSGLFSARYNPPGFLFDTKGSCIFPKQVTIRSLISFLNSKVAQECLKILCPTLDYSSIGINAIPVVSIEDRFKSEMLIKVGKEDWDAIETSWDFTTLPLLNPNFRQPTLKATYQKLRAHWQEMTLEMQRLEEENNRIFIDAYGLQDELTPEVPLNEITLTCNPWYRYNRKPTTEHTEYTEKERNPSVSSVSSVVNNSSSAPSVSSVVDKSSSVSSVSSVVNQSFPVDDELEALLLADTMRELVSYAVGCSFGRYSLDKPGLILANQGETTEDYRRKISTTKYTEYTEKENEPNHLSVPSVSSAPSVSSVSSVVVDYSFPPVDDNVIPMLDGDWFTNDITERFRQFLRVTFGEQHYEENLRFVEQALNIKNKRNYSIRDYFLGEFYTDHVKRYKKRPIYWLFSSGSGKSGGSFNALIYMHRYRPDTVSVVLNDYLREFRGKLSTRLDHLRRVEASADAGKAEKTQALKEIEKLKKTIEELDAWERDVMYPLATEQIAIDLDDGVKINYPKFGRALKKIPGLDAKGED